MEEGRLKPMPVDYDPELFKRLYEETKPLRLSLARQIDHHRLGVGPEDILSFFDTKFIYVFTKHYQDSPEKLKAFLLNAIRNFKCRILRSAYTVKNSQHIISTEDAHETVNWLEDDSTSDVRDFYYQKLIDFLKKTISDNALMVLQLQLNPPPYILARINTNPQKPLQKIPDTLLIEYLGLEVNNKTLKYIQGIKKEIKAGIALAKANFR